MHILSHLTICGLLVVAYKVQDLLTHAEVPLGDAHSTSKPLYTFGLSRATSMAPTKSLFERFRIKPHVDETTIRSADKLFPIVLATSTDATATESTAAEADVEAEAEAEPEAEPEPEPEAEAEAEAAAEAWTSPTPVEKPSTSGGTAESTPSPTGTDALPMNSTKHLIDHGAKKGHEASPLTSSGCCQHQQQKFADSVTLLQLVVISASCMVIH